MITFHVTKKRLETIIKNKRGGDVVYKEAVFDKATFEHEYFTVEIYMQMHNETIYKVPCLDIGF